MSCARSTDISSSSPKQTLNDESPAIHPELLAAVQLTLTGEAASAAIRLQALWEKLDPGDLFQRCILAHYLADLQSTPEAELRWDQQALRAALVAPASAFAGRIPGLTQTAFLPSLYLNVAASYERVGDMAAARAHALLAREVSGDVPETPLGELTRAAIERLCARLLEV